MSGTISAHAVQRLRLTAVPLAATALVAVALVGAPNAVSGTAASPRPIPGIRSPSGNIRCLYVPPPPGASIPVLLCSIGHAEYSAALQHRCASSPAGVDWHGFELASTRKGAVTCSGGILYNPSTERPTYSTLPYGRAWRQGPFTCVSRVSGVTCTTVRGHGLFISRQSWRAF
jgi:hypothetical protein